MANKNLLVNEEKTEYTTLQKEDQKKRKKRMEICDKTGIKAW